MKHNARLEWRWRWPTVLHVVLIGPNEFASQELSPPGKILRSKSGTNKSLNIEETNQAVSKVFGHTFLHFDFAFEKFLYIFLQILNQ